MSSGFDVFLTDDIGSESIDRVSKILAGVPHGADKAIGSAIRRAATAGKAYAAKVIRREYALKSGDFKSYTKSKSRIVTSGGASSLELEFRGNVIPLSKFAVSIGGDGRVRVKVKRSSGMTTLENVFMQSVGRHTGLFERTGTSRLPIEQKYGPSTPQMLSANDDLSQEVGDKVRETFDNRIEHEMIAILNGWRM